MKKIKFLALAALFVCNGLIITHKADANPPVITKGIKGAIGGVPTCHCPDDLGNCYCSTN